MAIIAIDFDGTCVTHEYPKIGKDIGAVPVLKALIENGHQLILWTMRDGDLLKEAIQWFTDNGIELYDTNNNPDQDWTTSPKLFANLYIDDHSLGAPLAHISSLSDRDFVNWFAVAKYLAINGYITIEQYMKINNINIYGNRINHS